MLLYWRLSIGLYWSQLDIWYCQYRSTLVCQVNFKMLNLYETSILAPSAISWDQSANNGVANDRSWHQWPNCYIFLVVQYFFHDGCSSVSIIIWCKNLHTSCFLPCFHSTPELLLLYFLLFFFFWAHDQLAKPFATVFEYIYIQTLVSFIST